MPLWTIYHPPEAYTDQDKREFAAAITANYVRIGLPKFYAVALFQPVDAASFLVGGEPTGKTVRIVVEHIAVHVDEDDTAMRLRTRESLNALIAPFTSDRGLDVEFHVDETPRDLWMIGGIAPPPWGSDAEKLWARENHPVPYDESAAPAAT